MLFNALLHAVIAHNHMPVAALVFTINILLACCAAIIAGADNFMLLVISIEAEHHAVIKNIELALEILIRKLFHIRHNAAIKLIDIGEALGDEVAAGLFAAHAAGTNRYDCFVFEMGDAFDDLGQVTEIF